MSKAPHLPYASLGATRTTGGTIPKAILAATLSLTAAGCFGNEPEEPAGGQENSGAPNQSGNPSATLSSPSLHPGSVIVTSESSGTEPANPDTAEHDPRAPRVYDRELVDFAAEIPNDALAYFEFESIDALEAIGLGLTTALDGTGGDFLNIASLTLPIASVGIDLSRIDHSAKLALAYVPVPGSLFPAPMLIAPAVDEGPLVTSFSALSVRGLKVRRIEGGYAVIESAELTESTERGGASLTMELQGKNPSIRGRFDTEQFLPSLKPMFTDVANSLNSDYRKSRPKISSSQLYQFDATGMLDAMQAATEVGFGFELKGDHAHLSVQLFDVAGAVILPSHTELSTTLNELSHHIEPNDPVSLVTAFDPETAVASLRNLWVTRSEWSNMGGDSLFAAVEGRPGAEHSLPDSSLDMMERATVRMLESFQPGAAVSFQMEPSKAHVAIYLAARNSSRAREAISLLLSKCDLNDWGFEMALPIRSMLNRTLVEDYSVRFDTRRLDFDQRAAMRGAFKKYLGDSSLHLKVATSGHHVLVVLGGDTAAVNHRIKEFSDKGLGDIEIVRAIDHLEGSDAATIMHTDLVKFLGQLTGLGAVADGATAADTRRELERELDESDAPAIIWRGSSGSDISYGASFDIASLRAAFEAFKRAGF